MSLLLTQQALFRVSEPTLRNWAETAQNTCFLSAGGAFFEPNWTRAEPKRAEKRVFFTFKFRQKFDRAVFYFYFKAEKNGKREPDKAPPIGNQMLHNTYM